MKTATSIPQTHPTPRGPVEAPAGAPRLKGIEEIECADCGSSITVLVIKPCTCGGTSHGG